MMHETSSKMGSSLVLWGEIEMQANCNLIDATNLWKPIKEYQNITAKHERNIDKQILCSNDDSALGSEDEEKLFFDPVGSHLIELRKYHTAQKALEESGKTMKRKTEFYDLTIPAFPLKYPFSQSVEAPSQDVCTNVVKFKDSPKEISKYEVDKNRVIFIKKVFVQMGISCIDNENVVLEYLSAILNSFLQKFVRRLSDNKYSDTFSKDEDLWNTLETTLHDFGISGISGLHAFYYENIVKKHDFLLNKCMDMHYQLKKQQTV